MSLQFSVGVLCCVCFYWWFIVWSYSLTLGSVCSFTVQCALPQCHHWYEQKNDLSVLSSQLLLSCFLTIGITYWTKYCSLRIWFSQYKRFFSHSYRALLLRVCLRYVCYFFLKFLSLRRSVLFQIGFWIDEKTHQCIGRQNREKKCFVIWLPYNVGHGNAKCNNK